MGKTLRVKSFIRGYHVYKEDWEPELNEERELRREPDNQVDPNAVAVMRPLARPVKDCDLNQSALLKEKPTQMLHRQIRKSLDIFLCKWLLV